MWLRFLCIFCTIFILCSCEKPVISEEESEQPEGNLTVSVFQIEQVPFARFTRGTASEACSRLNFAIYRLDGTRVKQTNQTAGDANYGTATFQLDEGDYILVVVGHSSNGNPTMTDINKIQFTNTQGYTDTFLCCTSVTIGDEAVDKQVSLDRIVSLCRFVITDEFPSNVKKMRFYYTGGSGAFDANTGLGCVKSKQDAKFDVIAGKKEFDIYTFLHEQEGNIQLTVTALDSNDNILNEREFDVPLQKNYITWCSGAFFSGSGSLSTTITGVTINTEWAGETHISF